jgi:hypothetical protein
MRAAVLHRPSPEEFAKSNVEKNAPSSKAAKSASLVSISFMTAPCSNRLEFVVGRRAGQGSRVRLAKARRPLQFYRDMFLQVFRPASGHFFEDGLSGDPENSSDSPTGIRRKARMEPKARKGAWGCRVMASNPLWKTLRDLWGLLV